jgi:hypothetical protein
MSKPEPILCRYQVQLDGGWHLASYHDPKGCVSKATGTRTGAAGTEPDWLKPVLHAAALGGYYIEPKDPPPYRIVWFSVDEGLNLLRFGHD